MNYSMFGVVCTVPTLHCYQRDPCVQASAFYRPSCSVITVITILYGFILFQKQYFGEIIELGITYKMVKFYTFTVQMKFAKMT